MACWKTNEGWGIEYGRLRMKRSLLASGRMCGRTARRVGWSRTDRCKRGDELIVRSTSIGVQRRIVWKSTLLWRSESIHAYMLHNLRMSSRSSRWWKNRCCAVFSCRLSSIRCIPSRTDYRCLKLEDTEFQMLKWQ